MLEIITDGSLYFVFLHGAPYMGPVWTQTWAQYGPSLAPEMDPKWGLYGVPYGIHNVPIMGPSWAHFGPLFGLMGPKR
jgi:hypothetical protein